MANGMSSHARDRVPEIAFASLKNSISIQGLKQDALELLREACKGAKIGKECIRYTRPDKYDLEAVARLMQAIAGSDNRVC